MRRLRHQLQLLFAKDAPPGGVTNPIVRDDSQLSRALVMLTFPAIVLVQWTFVPADVRAWFTVSVACILLLNAVGWLVDWSRRPRWMQMSLPHAAVVAIWFMAATTGGVAGGFAIVLLMPLLWFAIYADPRDVLLALAITATCLTLPVRSLLPQLPDQGDGLLRFGFMIVVLALLAGVRPLVVQLRRNVELADSASFSLRASHDALAHDLRTPLTAICGLADLAHQRLERDDDDAVEKVRDYTERISRLGWQAESIIDGVLELSRAGERLPSVQAIELEALVRRVAADVLGIRLRIDELPAQVVGHAVSIERILKNLLENAARHGRSGDRTRPTNVIVSGSEHAECWYIVVEDDGPGFADAELPVLFEPWRRGSASGDGGHGLGLAIVAAIVAQHGGRIEAANCDTVRGARVTFTIARGLESVTVARQHAEPHTVAG